MNSKQDKNRVKGFLAATLGALLLAFVGISLARAAASDVVLHPDPVALGIKNGEQGAVSVQVDQAENLYGVEFHLRFDPKIVQVVDADKSAQGVQLKPSTWFKEGFVAVNRADNDKGTIDYAVTLLNPAPPAEGSGTVATITFKATEDGTSPLKITKALLATKEAAEIEAQLQDGAIGVSASGQAPSVKLTTKVESGGSGGSGPNLPALPARNLLLLGAAGLGVLAFLGAIGFLLVIVLLRRR